jgi:hypothetical protein
MSILTRTIPRRSNPRPSGLSEPIGYRAHTRVELPFDFDVVGAAGIEPVIPTGDVVPSCVQLNTILRRWELHKGLAVSG